MSFKWPALVWLPRKLPFQIIIAVCRTCCPPLIYCIVLLCSTSGDADPQDNTLSDTYCYEEFVAACKHLLQRADLAAFCMLYAAGRFLRIALNLQMCCPCLAT